METSKPNFFDTLAHLNQDTQFEIRWHSQMRRSTEPPNPEYPNGVDVVAVNNKVKNGKESCMAVLPYPTPCCGILFLICKRCNLVVSLTTAGRSDDPNTITIQKCLGRQE